MTAPMLTMMACGCAGMVQHGNAHDGLPAGHPSCFTHSRCDVWQSGPDLTVRRARCAHYGKPVRRSECNYRGDKDGVCYCEQPSSLDLPFFVYEGTGSPNAADLCRCGYARIAHEPYWEAKYEWDRNWYKLGRIKRSHTSTFHAPRGQEGVFAEAERQRLATWTRNSQEAWTFDATLLSLREIASSLKCRRFEARGALEFDRFYCGCHSWD